MFLIHLLDETRVAEARGRREEKNPEKKEKKKKMKTQGLVWASSSRNDF